MLLDTSPPKTDNLVDSELESKNTPSHPVSCEKGKANGLDIDR